MTVHYITLYTAHAHQEHINVSIGADRTETNDCLPVVFEQRLKIFFTNRDAFAEGNNWHILIKRHKEVELGKLDRILE